MNYELPALFVTIKCLLKCILWWKGGKDDKLATLERVILKLKAVTTRAHQNLGLNPGTSTYCLRVVMKVLNISEPQCVHLHFWGNGSFSHNCSVKFHAAPVTHITHTRSISSINSFLLKGNAMNHSEHFHCSCAGSSKWKTEMLRPGVVTKIFIITAKSQKVKWEKKLAN